MWLMLFLGIAAVAGYIKYSSGIKLLAPLVSIVNGIPALATNIQKFIDFATQFLSRI